MSINRKPVIGFLLKTFPKLSETFILNEILELERQGLNLHIFSLRRPTDTQFHPAVSQVRAPVTYIPSLMPKYSREDEEALLAVNLELLQQNPNGYLSNLNFYRDRSEDRQLNELLQAGYLAMAMQKLGVTHLHVHFANVPTATAELAKQFCQIPYSITAHAKDIYLSEPEALNRRMASAEFVLTCTDYNRNYLESIATHNTPIHLAYHGLDLTRFRLEEDWIHQETMSSASPFSSPLSSPLPTSDTPLILSVGRFCEKKGFPYLFEACHSLKQKGLRFHCGIVGYGPLQEQFERQIEDLGIADVVTIIGQLTQDQLIEYYRQTDIFVLPCQVTEDGDRDGIPNVLLEAMAMRAPVISTDISGISELITSNQNGILVPEKDPHALSIELERLLQQPQLRALLGQAGQWKVHQDFALEANVKQVKDLLLQSIRQSSPTPQQSDLADVLQPKTLAQVL
ncbi:MAG: glycosyltransferase [Leptolyngbyaceae cyanobacterium MO_188.B28]|nr:glycosyltransferase [Leptolyngbyaceae cyanobacterium MO_188.B28]